MRTIFRVRRSDSAAGAPGGCGGGRDKRRRGRGRRTWRSIFVDAFFAAPPPRRTRCDGRTNLAPKIQNTLHRSRVRGGFRICRVDRRRRRRRRAIIKLPSPRTSNSFTRSRHEHSSPESGNLNKRIFINIMLRVSAIGFSAIGRSAGGTRSSLVVREQAGGQCRP